MPAASQGPAKPRSKDSLVLFVDMLGFAQVTNFTGYSHSRPLPRATMRSWGLKNMPWGDNFDSPDDVYRGLQKVVRRMVAQAQKRRRAEAPLATIVFSDAVYMVLASEREILWFARRAMLSFIRDNLPVRMGIASGTVTRLTFTSETLPTNDLVLSAPFMGTGIVNAYAAERCPLKGMRIFVQAAAALRIKEAGLEGYLLPLPEERWPPTATYEVNYLDLASSVLPALAVPLRVKNLKDIAPRKVSYHYTQTLDALKKMNAQLNRQRHAPGTRLPRL